jgi:acyl carrier protein
LLTSEYYELLATIELLYRKLTGTDRDVRPDDRLREDLAIDSLGAVELLVGIEDTCGVVLLDDPRTFEITTVGDLLALVAACRITSNAATS